MVRSLVLFDNSLRFLQFQPWFAVVVEDKSVLAPSDDPG
jgi:hypothetical protein